MEVVIVFILGLVAESKQLETKDKSDKVGSRFKRQTTRIHPSGPIGKLATRALLLEFRTSVVSPGQRNEDRQSKDMPNLVETCDVDLSQCQCAEVSRIICL